MTTIHELDVQVCNWAEKGITDHTPAEFRGHLQREIDKLAERGGYTLQTPGEQPILNLFGYGTVREVLCWPDGHGMFWGHEAADALGWDRAQFNRWAQDEWKLDLVQQRYEDEETAVLGWELIRHHPLGVSVWQHDDDQAEHHVDGMMSGPIMRYWCDLWLIDTGEIFMMMMGSPWGKEWLAAVKPMMAWGFEKSGLGDVIGDVPSIVTRPDSMGSTVSEPGPSLRDAIARDRDGLTEQQAIEQAMRGPVFPAATDPDDAGE